MSEKLQELISRCKCSVTVSVNDHRDYYRSVSEALIELDICMQGIEINEDVRAKMIELDTIIEVRFYPDTPISFYLVYHFDLELALDEALACLGEKDGRKDKGADGNGTHDDDD